MEKGWNWMCICVVFSVDEYGNVECWYGIVEDIYECKFLEFKLIKVNWCFEI